MATQAEPVVSGPAAAVKRVAVVGGGTMGNGIAQVFATAGLEVALIDVKPEFVERALGTIGKNLDRVAKKQGWEASKAPEILGRIRGGTSLEGARDASLVVEAVSEEFGLKRTVFETLDRLAPADAVLASNTSSISITEIAAVTRRADRVIGMHFMNPVPVMALVEIIRGLATSDATCALTEDLSPPARQDAGRGQRLSRLRLEPRPDAHDQRGGLLPDGGRGLGGGDRHGDEARHEPSRWARSRSPT